MKYYLLCKAKCAFYVLAAIALLTSCAKLPIYKSESLNAGTKMEAHKSNTSNFDKSNNVHYSVAHTDTHLFVKATFHDEQSLLKIMRGGLNISFDPEGKKGKNYHLKIERDQKEPRDRTAFSQQNMATPNNRQRELPSIINRTLNKVTWDANGKDYVFYRDLQKHIIDVDLQTNEFNELGLLVKMPLSELPIPENNLFSIGIETGTFSSPAANNPNGGMRPSAGMGGGRGSGMGGGMGGGGMRGSGGRPGGGGGGSSPNTSPLKIWFLVEL